MTETRPKSSWEVRCEAAEAQRDELLAALKAAYELFGEGGNPKKVIAQVEAAIAKAEHP